MADMGSEAAQQFDGLGDVLSRAQNMLGDLDPEIRRRLIAYLTNPTTEGWDDIHSILIAPSKTVWQAVLKVAPDEAPRSGRATDIDGNVVKDWERIPSAQAVFDAIDFIGGPEQEKDAEADMAKVGPDQPFKCPDCGHVADRSYENLPETVRSNGAESDCPNCGGHGPTDPPAPSMEAHADGYDASKDPIYEAARLAGFEAEFIGGGSGIMLDTSDGKQLVFGYANGPLGYTLWDAEGHDLDGADMPEETQDPRAMAEFISQVAKLYNAHQGTHGGKEDGIGGTASRRTAELVRDAYAVQVANRSFEVAPVYAEDLSSLVRYDVHDELNRKVLEIPAAAPLSKPVLEQAIFDMLPASGLPATGSLRREASNPWDVFLDGKLIDTVFDESTDPEDVKRSLVGHDGYDPNIEVRFGGKGKPKKKKRMPVQRPKESPEQQASDLTRKREEQGRADDQLLDKLDPNLRKQKPRDPFRCAQCPNEFWTPDTLALHMENVHETSMPESPADVKVIDQKDRQRKLDSLLDQYSAEQDPERRTQLEEQMRSLRAALRGMRVTAEDTDEEYPCDICDGVGTVPDWSDGDGRSGKKKPCPECGGSGPAGLGKYEHGPECFCDECLAIDEEIGFAAPYRCPSCGSRECPGDGSGNIPCRKPGTQAPKDVPVASEDDVLDALSRGEITPEQAAARMRRLKSGLRGMSVTADGEERVVRNDGLRVWERVPKDQNDRVPSIVLPAGSRLKITRTFNLDHGGEPQLGEVMYWREGGDPASKGGGFGFVRLEDMGFATIPAPAYPGAPERKQPVNIDHIKFISPEELQKRKDQLMDEFNAGSMAQDEFEARMEQMRSMGRRTAGADEHLHRADPEKAQRLTDLQARCGSCDHSAHDHMPDAWRMPGFFYSVSLERIMGALSQKPCRAACPCKGFVPDDAPASPADVTVMDPKDRARKLDSLLDQLNETEDPAERAQIEERMRSLKAMLAALWLKTAAEDYERPLPIMQGDIRRVTKPFKADSDNHSGGVYAMLQPGMLIEVEQAFENDHVKFVLAPKDGEKRDKYNPPSLPAYENDQPGYEHQGKRYESQVYRMGTDRATIEASTELVTAGQLAEHGPKDQAYITWDGGDADAIVEDYRERIANGDYDGDRDPWVLGRSLSDEWDEAGRDGAAFLALVKQQGLEKQLKSALQDQAYKDSDAFGFQWEQVTEDLTALMHEQFPGTTVWRANVRGFGWMKEDNDGTVTAKNGTELLQGILPNTDCHFEIYNRGTHLEIHNSHHDGSETYYVAPFDAPPVNPEPTPASVQRAVAPEMADELEQYHEQRRERTRPKETGFQDPNEKITPEMLEEAPEFASQVPTMDPRQRQQKLDQLLDQYSTEEDPERKQQIEEQMRSLRASLRAWLKTADDEAFNPETDACDKCQDTGEVDGKACPKCQPMTSMMEGGDEPIYEDMPEEPSDDDVIVKDERGTWRAYYAGHVIEQDSASGDGLDGLLWKVKRWMDASKFWPNVWEERERGGFEHVDMTNVQRPAPDESVREAVEDQILEVLSEGPLPKDELAEKVFGSILINLESREFFDDAFSLAMSCLTDVGSVAERDGKVQIPVKPSKPATPKKGPTSPEDLASIHPTDRQRKLDTLLDQYAKEQDPGRKKQLEQQMRSLSASLRRHASALPPVACDEHPGGSCHLGPEGRHIPAEYMNAKDPELDSRADAMDPTALYDQWISDPEGEAAWQEAYEMFPGHNGEQAGDAADWLIGRMEQWAARRSIRSFERMRDSLYESIYAGLT